MIRFVAVIPVLFLALDAFAQGPVSISPMVSFDYGKPLFINRSGTLNPFGIAPTGNSSAFSYGLGAELQMPEIFSRQIGLDGRIQYIYSTGSFIFDAPKYSISGIDRKLLFEANASWNFQPFQINIGPWFSQAISRSVYENDPNGVRIASGDTTASDKTHLGIAAGLAWKIPGLTIVPEINSHLDLTELRNAGANALSIGISLSYSPHSTVDSVPSEQGSERVETRSTPVVPSRVRFLVDRSEIMRSVPLERVEMRVKQYSMVDSANTSPRVTQWVLESYHLPQIGVKCEVDRDAAGELTMMKDDQNLAEFSIPKAGTGALTFDTTFDLEEASVWRDALSKLNINESNTVIAQLQTFNSSGSQITQDTLILPPVDTNHIVRTIVKKQFRFFLTDRYSEFESGPAMLDLLVGRMKTLLDSNVLITISGPRNARSARHQELMKRLISGLGVNSAIIRNDDGSEISGGLLVVFDL